MIEGIQGAGWQRVLRAARPTFAWDALRSNRALIAGQTGTSIPITVDFPTTDDPDTNPWCVWDPGDGRFRQVTKAGNPGEFIGAAGHFYDGYLRNYFPVAWADATLGFAVVTPTASGCLYQETGVSPDIVIGTTHGDVTVLDTDEDATNDTIVERTVPKNGTYNRMLQVLVKSEDDLDPATYVKLGLNTTADTRTLSSSTWCRKLPGTRGWYAVMLGAGTGTGNYYASIGITKETGRWFVAAPIWYSRYSTFENVTRNVVPVDAGPTTYKDAQWFIATNTAQDGPNLTACGWLAMSVVLPDRSVSNGHLDYSGAANYKFLGLLNTEDGTNRLRVSMSDTNDHLVVSIGTIAGVNGAYLDCSDDWLDFGAMGIVATWFVRDATYYAALYVNGQKLDSVATASPAAWFPQVATAWDKTYIGASGNDGTAAECWISRVAMGRSILHRARARALSAAMQQMARGQR